MQKIAFLWIYSLFLVAVAYADDVPLAMGATGHSGPGRSRQLRDSTWNPQFPDWSQMCKNGQEGLDQLLNHETLELAVPAKLFVQAIQAGILPGSAKAQYLQYGFVPSPPSRNDDQRQALGLPRGYDIPLGLTVVDKHDGKSPRQAPLDDKYVYFNCLTCHSGMRANRVILGASNQNFNAMLFQKASQGIDAGMEQIHSYYYTNFVSKFIARQEGLELTEGEKAWLERMKLYGDNYSFAAVAPATSRKNRVGNNFGYAPDYFQHTGQVRTEGGLERFPYEMDYNVHNKPNPMYRELSNMELPPVLPFAWFIHREKEGYSGGAQLATYRYAEERRFPDYSNFGAPAFLRKDATPEEVERMRTDRQVQSNRIARVWKLFDCLPSPNYPFAIDTKKAFEGCRIYNQSSCIQCHGKFQRDDASGKWYISDYKVGKLVNIGTDPTYSKMVQTFGKEAMDADKASPSTRQPWYYPRVNLRPIVGGQYTPPPLIGLWARAPYLHNGSVPTVWDLITPRGSKDEVPTRRSSRGRATYYYMGNPNGYDKERLGMPWKQVSQSEFIQGIKGPNRDHYYSTKEYGLSDSGHPFGIADVEQRKSVLECLKMMSGDNVLMNPPKHESGSEQASNTPGRTY